MEKDSRRAGEERVTTLTQERLKIAVNTARLALAEIEKRDMVDAVQRYLQCLQTCRVLVTAKNAFQLEEEKLQNISLRYAAGLGAEMELLQQNNVCLKMKEEMETAEYEYFQSRLAFLQGVGQEKSNAFPFEVNVTSIEIEKYDFFLCLEKARAADSVFYSTHETLALAKKQWEVIQDLEDATAEERENAANELDRAEENCCLYERELHNRIFGVLEEFGLLIRRLELAERQAALARREQED